MSVKTIRLCREKELSSLSRSLSVRRGDGFLLLLCPPQPRVVDSWRTNKYATALEAQRTSEQASKQVKASVVCACTVYCLSYSGRYFLGSPGKGVWGARLKCPIRKMPIVPRVVSIAMTKKHILSITRAARNHSSFS